MNLTDQNITYSGIVDIRTTTFKGLDCIDTTPLLEALKDTDKHQLMDAITEMIQIIMIANGFLEPYYKGNTDFMRGYLAAMQHLHYVTDDLPPTKSNDVP